MLIKEKARSGQLWHLSHLYHVGTKLGFLSLVQKG